MYQNCCTKCGSIALHTEVKGNNTGLYCDDCGAWIKWLGKDELRAFEYSMREATKEERESVDNYIKSISKPTGVNFFDEMNKTTHKLDYSELREEIHKILCDFLAHEHPLQNDGEFDFEYLEFRTDEILRLIKRQGGSITK